MRRGVILSAALHATVTAVAIVGLPVLFKPEPLVVEPIAVELVTEIAKPAAPEPAKPAPAKPEPPKPEPKPEPPKEAAAPPPPPPPPPPQAAPEPPKPVAAPPPPPAPPKPAEPEPIKQAEAPPPPRPEPKPEPPKPEPQVAQKTPEPPTPQRKPDPPKPEPQPQRPEPPKKKPDTDSFDALLNNLVAEKKPAPREAPRPQRDQVAAATPSPARPPAASSIDQQRRAAELVDRVRDQVVRCWSIPAGVKDAREKQVAVRILLNPDGSLRGAPRIEDARAFETDPSYRAVAESARRALYQCTPLKLPFDQWDTWKDITFIFDPKDVLH